MANRTFENFGHFYAPHTFPVLLDCNFIVDAANGNGLGIRSLKGPGIRNIYMHTSTTPGTGTNGVLNPNPANGVILVQLGSNYYRYFTGFSGFVSPLTTPQATTTNHVAYVITALGTATLAQWQAVGLPLGLTPAVGQAFIATATGTIGGSATVAPTATAGAGIDHIEVLGDPNLTLSPVGPQGGGSIVTGGWIVLQCFEAGAIAAPADGSTISLSFYLSNSSVLVKGE